MTRILQPRLFLAVLAGGESRRARRGDGTAPKQFREAGGRMLLMHGLLELVCAPGVACVVVVVPDAWRPLVEPALKDSGLKIPWLLAGAGPHRTASAWSALCRLADLTGGAGPEPSDLVAIHDAARPFASRYLLARLARAAARHGAAVPGVAVSDTIVQLAAGQEPVEGGREQVLAAYLPRPLLVAVQTPQVARWRDLYAAHAWAAEHGGSFTDDGGLLAARGLAPAVVMGEPGNWKITTDEDWERATGLLVRAQTS